MSVNLYNNKTIEQIEQNLPPNMSDFHRLEYINNCKKVIERQTTGYNLNEIEGIKNYNFILIKLYYTPLLP